MFIAHKKSKIQSTGDYIGFHGADDIASIVNMNAIIHITQGYH